eukprot:5281657-Alexandrium_andersonii.AAC.1
MVPYSKSDTPNGLAVLIQQRVYTSCYTRMRELRDVPVGIPPRPKTPSAPADGGEKRKASDIGGSATKKTPPMEKPGADPAVGGGKSSGSPAPKTPPKAKGKAKSASADDVGGQVPQQVAAAVGIQ